MMLSPKQAEVLAHRLSTPERLTDALALEHGDREVIMGTTQRLLEHAQRRLIPHEAYETDLAKAILKDAVEGSTWLAEKVEGKKRWEISSAKLKGCRKTAKFLAQRLRDNGIDCGEMQE
jgi:hypothetical protein